VLICGNRSVLASGLCVLDNRQCVFGVDDDYGEPGQFESVRVMRSFRFSIFDTEGFPSPPLHVEISSFSWFRHVHTKAWHGSHANKRWRFGSVFPRDTASER
jgi:hypothetical protein